MLTKRTCVKRVICRAMAPASYSQISGSSLLQVVSRADLPKALPCLDLTWLYLRVLALRTVPIAKAPLS
eukprot:scaffold4284_cov153-Pinguiococcus_pyrenoidosus.AAC.1